MRITYYTNENTQECLVTMEKDGEVKDADYEVVDEEKK